MRFVDTENPIPFATKVRALDPAIVPARRIEPGSGPPQDERRHRAVDILCERFEAIDDVVISFIAVLFREEHLQIAVRVTRSVS